MRAKVATPYGVKTLLECMARATLLAQPDDISTFLTRYIKNMFRSRTEDGKDVKVVAFDYEEDWEKNILKREEGPAPVLPQIPVPGLKYEDPFVAAVPSSPQSPVGPDFDARELGRKPPVESLPAWLSAPSAVQPIKVDRPKLSPAEEATPVLFPERKPLTLPMRSEFKPTLSRSPPSVAGRSTSSPVEGSGLSSLWFPKEGDFFAQTKDTPLDTKQKVPSQGKEKKENVRTRRLPPQKLPNQENIGTQTGDLKPDGSPRYRAGKVLSLRGQPEPKPGGRAARSLYPPPSRKSTSEIPKQVKKKPTKKPEKDFVCHDLECPYHRKPGQQCAVTCPLQPTGPSRESKGRVPDMWSGAARPKTKNPYRPRGGYLYDPQLDTKKTRGSKKPVLHRPSSAESIFLIVRPPSLGGSEGAQTGGATAAAPPPPPPPVVQVVPEVTPHFASFIKHRCLYLQDRSTRALSPTMCAIKIPQGPVTNIKSVRNMQSHLTQCNQLHEIRWI